MEIKRREASLERKFTEACQREGWRVRKYTSPGHAGEPDRIVFAPAGVCALAELKQEGKKPSDLQKLAIGELESLGFIVVVIDDIMGIASFIARVRDAVRSKTLSS